MLGVLLLRDSWRSLCISGHLVWRSHSGSGLALRKPQVRSSKTHRSVSRRRFWIRPARRKPLYEGSRKQAARGLPEHLTIIRYASRQGQTATHHRLSRNQKPSPLQALPYSRNCPAAPAPALGNLHLRNHTCRLAHGIAPTVHRRSETASVRAYRPPGQQRSQSDEVASG